MLEEPPKAPRGGKKWRALGSVVLSTWGSVGTGSKAASSYVDALQIYPRALTCFLPLEGFWSCDSRNASHSRTKQGEAAEPPDADGTSLRRRRLLPSTLPTHRQRLRRWCAGIRRRSSIIGCCIFSGGADGHRRLLPVGAHHRRRRLPPSPPLPPPPHWRWGCSTAAADLPYCPPSTPRCFQRSCVVPGGEGGCCWLQMADSFDRRRHLCSGVVGGSIGGLESINRRRKEDVETSNDHAI